MVFDKSILIIDDNLISRTILSGLFKKEYEVLEAENGEKGLAILLENPSKIAAILLDLNMPIMNGYDFIEKMKELNLMGKIPVIIVTAETSEQVETKVLEMGVSDIVNSPIVPKTVYCRVQNVISANYYRQNLEATAKDLTSRLKKSNEVMIDTLSSIIEHRSLESGQHIKRIRRFTEILLNTVKDNYPEYNLDNKIIQCIASASTLHDIGKIVIPDSILNKPGRLTQEEFEIMKSHTTQGGGIIKKLHFVDKKDYLEYAFQIAMYHHERYDGKGYPTGLKGEDIPLCAQVAAIADVYDALTTPRVYKPAFSHEKTVRMIISGECGAFSEKIKHCFRLVAPQFEEKARQYRDGEINLDEFGFDLSNEIETQEITEYLDSYRYKAIKKETGTVILEIDYNTKEYTFLHQNFVDFSSVPLFGNIMTDIPTFIDKFVHPEDCDRILNKAFQAKAQIEMQNFIDDRIFVRLQTGENDTYQWHEIKQIKLKTPDNTNCKTIVIFRNIEDYINQDFTNFEVSSILDLEQLNTIDKNEEQLNSDKILDVGLTSDMIYEIFRTTCDILYILNIDNGKAIFNYVDEDDFAISVPNNINDFVNNNCIKIHEDDFEGLLEKTTKAVHSAQEVNANFRMMSKNGIFKEYEQKIVPITDSTGNVSHIMGFINYKRA